jgi:hypothetical protein
MIHTVQFKNKNEDGDMQQKFPPPKKVAPPSHSTWTLVDSNALKERGYNPYDTVVHVKDTRDRDVWRDKPKRA